MMKRMMISVLFLMGMVGQAQVSYAVSDFDIFDLGIMSDPELFPVAYSLNNHGEVVGAYGSNSFYWKEGVFTRVYGRPYDINNNGVFVGYSLDPNIPVLDEENQRFLNGDTITMWEDGTPVRLGTLGGLWNEAYGINDHNQVVGHAGLYSGFDRAFLWDNGTMKDLPTPDGKSSYAYAINNSSQIVGAIRDYDVYHHGRAVMWEGDTVTDLNFSMNNFSYPMDINNEGEVILNDGSSSFLWDDAVLTDLYPWDQDDPINHQMMSFAVNDAGAIVGYGVDFDQLVLPYGVMSLTYYAFLLEEGKFYNLNDFVDQDSGWDLMKAFDINENGEIIGLGRFDGWEHGFLLRPRMVPEPVGTALFLMGGAVMSFRISRKRTAVS